MKKLPIGIQTFSEIIREDYVYVDKTLLIYTMITTGKYYFLSRPRRFGKSLLISTFADVFSGNKDLFKGLAIYSLPYDWKKYPVISISFADIRYTTAETLEKGIILHLQRIAKQYQVVLTNELSSGEMLQELVMELSINDHVVLLIDEHDYPIIQHIHNESSAHAMRETLKAFYSVIKGLDKYLQFCFLTGVSKFSQTSIFSGLNNLNDISLDRKFNELLGYTKNEIITHFQPYLTDAAHYNQCSQEELLTQITEWYDGYNFTAGQHATKMYNPFSVLLFLSKQVFSNYWFKTGTPTFLINLFKKYNYSMQDFDHIEATENELGAFEIENISLKTLLFQTGYLTIKSYNNLTRNYLLTYPNKETINFLTESLNKEIILVGIAFDTTLNNISEIKHEKL